MQKKTYNTSFGAIHYWVNLFEVDRLTIAFLPGLTADHRLFDDQIAHFKDSYNVFTWDAPGHAASRPFQLNFTLMDKAQLLKEILNAEGVERVLIVGQSMGGYVWQAFAQQYPQHLLGFVSVDSAPLARHYMTSIELWLLKRMEPVYRCYPWNLLLKSGSEGVSTTPREKALMRDMMRTYEGDQRWYAALAGHGYRMLAEAVEADLPYTLPKHSLLICGKEDYAGSCIRYNKAWHRESGIPIVWIDRAGHNANVDAPDEVNTCIEQVIDEIQADMN